jgi:hypothetical protein
MPDLVRAPVPTAPPETTWIDPRELLVDESYQRNLSERSLSLIRRIAANWDWRRFKAPNVAWTDEGLEVIDGQHTAIGAACRDDIQKIPVLVTEAPERADRASAFIGLNRDRVAITATQLHAAAVTAGDAEAMAIEEACRSVGITVLKVQPGAGRFKPRDTMAVAAIGALVKRYGVVAALTLRVVAEAELAPIQASHIKAVELLLTDVQFGQPEPEDITSAIKAVGVEAESEAKLFAATHCVPLWRGLAAVWFKKVPKRRKSAPPVLEPILGVPLGVTAGTPQVSAPLIAAPAPPAPAILDDVKRDRRAFRGRWQPGRYMRRCTTCDARFEGAVNSTECADCAYAEASA